MLSLLLLLACRSSSTPAAPTPPTTPTGIVAHTSLPGSTGRTGSSGRTGDTAPDPIPSASRYILRNGAPPTNVLLLSIDTTRADHINSNGYSGSVTSPTIDGLLERGLALRSHRSCSTWTMPSFLCVYTGMDALALGVWPTTLALEPQPLEQLPSLAWRLQQEGFATRLITANGLLTAPYRMDQGFDTTMRTYEAAQTGAAGLAELVNLTNAGDPWFLQVHFMAPHKPYNPDPAFLKGDTSCPGHDLTDRDGFHAFRTPYATEMTTEEQQACQDHLAHLYDALIREVDHHIGRLLDALETSGQAESTAIVFLTDHGESFYEHGEWEHSWGGNVDTLTRSTAGFVYPPRIEPAAHAGLTTHEDILPTLFTLLDLPIPADVTGLPVGAAHVDATFQLSYRGGNTVQSVVTADDKLIYTWDEGFAYHDLRADPMELNDLYDPAMPRVQQLWALLEPKVLELSERVTDGSQPLFLPDAPTTP